MNALYLNKELDFYLEFGWYRGMIISSLTFVRGYFYLRRKKHERNHTIFKRGSITKN